MDDGILLDRIRLEMENSDRSTIFLKGVIS